MQRLLLTPIMLVLGLGVTVATPLPALAKGATSVTVSGPGVVDRSLDYTRAGRDVDLSTLAEASGIYGIFGDGMYVERPGLTAAELGPRYVLTWYEGDAVMAVSHVYPFAEGGAWASVPPGQRLFGHRMDAGWWQGGPALQRAMVRLGAVEPAYHGIDQLDQTEPAEPAAVGDPSPDGSTAWAVATVV